MSGIEVAGLVLGGLPLIVSAVEYSGKVKKFSKSAWRFRAMYSRERALVTHCETIFGLHLQALLQPLLSMDVVDQVQYDGLLSNPGGDGWKTWRVEESLERRLAGTYPQYLKTLQTLQSTLVKLSQKVKTQDPRFKQWLDDSLQNAAPARKDLVQRANDKCAQMVHVASLSSREELLHEVEAYINRLRDHLDSAQRVVVASRDPPAFAKVPVPQFVQGFWSTAKRIYRLMQRCFPCSCAASHCARLRLDQQSLLSKSLDLQLLFNKSAAPALSTWARAQFDLANDQHKAAASCPCETQTGSLKLAAPSQATAANVVPQITIHPPQQSSGSSRLQSVSNESSLCTVLGKPCHSWRCLGSVYDDLDDCFFHVLHCPPNAVTDSISLADVLDPRSNHVFPLVLRIRVAKAMAIAHLRYHQSNWLQDPWKLRTVHFPKRSVSDLDFETPCILSHFACGTPRSSADSTVDFAELGIVLLELAYGMPIESHPLWHDPNHPGRDSSDPIVRKGVAYEWAKGLPLLIPGEGYVHAVQWCLYQTPQSSNSGKWRPEFADNVVAPLQAYK